jgi:hypothetical protein
MENTPTVILKPYKPTPNKPWPNWIMYLILLFVFVGLAFGSYFMHLYSAKQQLNMSVFYKKDNRTNICFAYWHGNSMVVPCENIPKSLYSLKMDN